MAEGITYTCNGPLINIGEGQRERLGCGADLTQMIEAVPVDGAEQAVSCEACGTVTTVRRVPTEGGK